MSSTKIVIIVLILVAVIFTVFVVRGAFREEPPPPKGKAATETAAKKTEPPGWTETIKGLFSSLQPTIELKQSAYCSKSEEIIKADDKHAFRTVTFHLQSGRAKIVYTEKFPPNPTGPLKDLEFPQDCTLPQDDDDVAEKDRGHCSIVATKPGGKLTFECLDTAPCRVTADCSPADDPRCRKKC